MARINLRTSTLAGSPAASRSTSPPTPSPSSDQENDAPGARRRDKGKQPMRSSSRTSLPTPTSDDTASVRGGQKRKRTLRQADAPQADHLSDDMDSDDKRFTRYYDPDQDIEQRRQAKRKSRALQREINEQRDILLQSNGPELEDLIRRSNQNFKNIKQTNDATLDARTLVDLSGIARKNAESIVLGDMSTGLDVDDFLGKCIAYMRRGPQEVDDEGGATQRTFTQRRQLRGGDEEEDEDEDEPLDFAYIGTNLCFPYNSRPPCPSFLLGPLSVEKKIRAQTQRRVRQAQDHARETAPEKIGREDMNQADPNSLTAICTEIRDQLHKHVDRAHRAIERIEASEGRASKARQQELCRQFGITDTGHPSLFEFVINPLSFGQTVENLFYVSFLIKEGNAGIVLDSRGMPTLSASKPREVEDQRREKIVKNQTVFSLDYCTWLKLIKAFKITKSMIPHREERQAAHLGARGWYA